MSDLNPYDLNNLAGGAIRALFAPIDETLPARIGDAIDLSSPYAPNGDWVDFGATTGPFTVNRSITKAGGNIQQEDSAILEEVTEVVRTVSAPFAELRPEIIQMIEEGAASAATTVGAGHSAQTKQPFGSIEELTQYRMMFIARRKKAQGTVREGVAGTVYRGRFLAYAAYRVELAAENISIPFEKGALASATVTFKLYPDPTITEPGEEYGAWFDEDAGILALV